MHRPAEHAVHATPGRRPSPGGRRLRSTSPALAGVLAAPALLMALLDGDAPPPPRVVEPVPAHVSVAAWGSSPAGDPAPRWTVTLRVLQHARSGGSGADGWARAPAAAPRDGAGFPSARLPGPEAERPARAVALFRGYLANAPPPPAS